MLVAVTGGTGFVGARAIAAKGAAGRRSRMVAGGEAAADALGGAGMGRALPEADAVLPAAWVCSLDGRRGPGPALPGERGMAAHVTGGAARGTGACATSVAARVGGR